MRGQPEPGAKICLGKSFALHVKFPIVQQRPIEMTRFHLENSANGRKCDRTFRVQDLLIVTGLRSLYAIILCISVIVSMAMERDGSLSGENGYVCRGRKPCPAFPMVNACQRLPHCLNVNVHTLLNLTHNMHSHTSICSLLK